MMKGPWEAVAPEAAEPSTTRGRFCPKPFEALSIDAGGMARICCEDWLSTAIGDMGHQTLFEAWNSPQAQEIRASILDGSYRFCNAETCPDIVGGTLPLNDEVVNLSHRHYLESGTTRLAKGPLRLGLGYDNSCNLKCPSCRSELITLKGSERAEAERIQNEVLRALPDAELLVITGTGDAFASPLYRKFLRTFDADRWPNVRIALMTNGLMFTPAMWDSIAAAHGAIEGVSISVDAATAETYALNRGGDFTMLLRNLRFVRRLLTARELEWFELSFVVQRNNYLEMKDFVNLALDIGCTGVVFQKIVHWDGTFSKETFRDVAIHRPDHPQHTDFLAVLQDQALADSRVDLTNLANLRNASPVTVKPVLAARPHPARKAGGG